MEAIDFFKIVCRDFTKSHFFKKNTNKASKSRHSNQIYPNQIKSPPTKKSLIEITLNDKTSLKLISENSHSDNFFNLTLIPP